MTLLAAWNFDEASGDVVDYSGNSRGFAVSGSTVRTASGSGHTAKGLTQTSAAVTTGPSLTGLQTTSRTIEAWVKITASVTAWALEFYNTANDTGGWGWLYLSGSFRFRAKDTSFTVYEQTLTVDTGNWHHLAATHNGTTLKVYRDGVQVGVDISMPVAVLSCDVFRVLDQVGTAIVIDDVRLYDTVLDAAAITTDMNTPVAVQTSGFQGWGIPIG